MYDNYILAFSLVILRWKDERWGGGLKRALVGWDDQKVWVMGAELSSLTCLVVMMMVKVTAPNSAIVWKMNSWPVVEQMERATTSPANPPWVFMKSTAGSRPPCSTNEKPVNITCQSKNILVISGSISK